MQTCKKYLFHIFQILLFIFALTASKCGIYSQKAEDIFADGKLPTILAEAANPRLPLKLQERILQRVIRQKINPKPLLKIAVIDNGIDYLHPSIYDQLDFQIEGNKIVGAGFDVMGDNNWPHHNIINASLFAFGSKEIDKNAKIVAPVTDPIKLLDEHNKAFITLLMERISVEPNLKDSLFSKINLNNLSILGIYGMLETRMFPFKQKQYNEMEEERFLWNKDVTQHPKYQESLIEYPEIYGKKIRNILDLPWQMDLEIGMPHFNAYPDYSTLDNIEGAADFYRIIKELYAEYNDKYHFAADFERYFEFRYNRSAKRDSPKEYKKDLLRDLHKIWHKAKFNHTAADPFTELGIDIKNQLPLADVLRLEANDLTYDEKVSLLLGHFTDWFETTKKILNYRIKSKATTEDNKYVYRESLKKVNDVKARFIQLVQSRDLTDFFKPNVISYLDDSTSYTNYSKKVNNPYLDSSSASTSHGSHVATTIMAQNKNIQIVPIRVITAGKLNSKYFNKIILGEFLNDFRQWMEKPLIVASILNDETMRKIVDPDERLLASNSDHVTIVRKKVMSLIKDYLTGNLSKHQMDIEFFSEIKDAIKIVGEQKIKIANISLGTSFKDVPTRLNPENIGQLSKDMVKYLYYEFFKYSVAEEIEKSASKTIFFVASGNDGDWINGRAKSALPTDLSSSFLKQAELSLKTIAPNNRIKNIVSVGSVGPDHFLSGFSNLPISDIPVTLAPGEAINAAIKLTDTQGAKQNYAREFGSEIDSIRISIYDDREIKMVKEMGLVDLNLPEDKLERAVEIVLDKFDFAANSFLSKAQGMLKLDYCIHDQRCSAKLHGTSMATPNSSGVTGDLVINKMIALNLTDAEIYDHPSFTVAKVQKMVLENGNDYNEGIISHLKVHANVKPYVDIKKSPLSSSLDDCLFAMAPLLK